MAMNSFEPNPSRALSTLILIRHAHTGMAGSFCGSSDPPLSTQGLSQLDGVNRKLAAYPLTRVFSSDLQRARQTAEYIACHRKLQIEYHAFLRELAFGSWEGLDWSQVMERDKEYAQRWVDCYPSLPAPGGEHYEDFVQRVKHVMTAIAAQVKEGCAAVVTHAGVIRTFLGSLMPSQSIAAECGFTSFWEVRCDAGQWHLPVAAPVVHERDLQAGFPV